MALAACLALMVLAGGAWHWWPGESSASRPWVVREFAAVAPVEGPFPADRPLAPEQFARMVTEGLTVPVSMKPMAEAASRHRLRIVEITVRTDEQGGRFVEVRLNCCGEPVLLALARSDGASAAALLQGLSKLEGMKTLRIDELNVVERDLGGVVAVAVSRHPLGDLMNSLAAGGA